MQDQSEKNKESEEVEGSEKEKEEEEEEEEKEKEEVSLANVATHQALLDAKGLSPQQIQKALQGMPEKERQKLWKKFGRTRQSEGTDAEYKKYCTGSGAREKQNKALEAFLRDGGSCGELYAKQMLKITHKEENTVESQWKTRRPGSQR